MTSPTNWPHPDRDPELWMRHQEKKLLNEQRRPIVRKAADILGPGFGPLATEVEDWSADETAFNGYFWTDVGGANTPEGTGTKVWIGNVSTNGTVGVQRVRAMGDVYEWQRTWTLGVGSRTYTSWVATAVGTQPYAVLTATASTAISGETNVNLPTVTNNYSTYFDTGTSNLIGILEDGLYIVSGFCMNNSGVASDKQHRIRLTGASGLQLGLLKSFGSTNFGGSLGGDCHQITAGQTVRLTSEDSVAASTQHVSGTLVSRLTVRKIG